MSEIPVVIVIDENADMAVVLDACQAVGLKQVSLVSRFRVLRGVIDADRKQKLREVPGVQSVQIERDNTALAPAPHR
jgi:hypothetical protein